jgi:hypothetical protein
MSSLELLPPFLELKRTGETRAKHLTASKTPGSWEAEEGLGLRGPVGDSGKLRGKAEEKLNLGREGTWGGSALTLASPTSSESD